ncbi:MAG TPA: HRDC domain-containing protein [Acidimicrobiales bacterium]|nr:HRDC domain-containing protein [Acidimicrobiales bacterium]
MAAGHHLSTSEGVDERGPGTGGPEVPEVPPEIVTTKDGLASLIDRLEGSAEFALDTEFHRERTYWPRLALVQVAWRNSPRDQARVALIDPLAVDPLPLARVLAGPSVMVAHAATQDLEVLARACDALPLKLFDTQIAAGFLGHGSASLSSLAERYLRVRLSKGDRLTDWSRRPLTQSQLAYAASDVAYLLVLADAISAQLAERGRLEWAEEECMALLARPQNQTDPNEAWWKLRDNRHLQGVSRAIAQELAAWREEKARALDVQPRMVLADLALLSIAHSPPASVAALRETRGIDARHLRGNAEEEIMAAVGRGKAMPPKNLRLAQSEPMSKELRPAVTLATAWVAQLSRDEEVDAALLATRTDVIDFLSGKPDARLGRGWRAGLVGAPLRRLADGRASLALDGHGRLLLEERCPPAAS